MQPTSEAVSNAVQAGKECKPSDAGAPAASIGLDVEPGTGNASRLNQVVQQGWLSGHRSISDLSSHEGYQDFRSTWTGMGTELISESYVEGGPLGFDNEGRLLGREIIHKVYLEVWYIYEGKRGSIKQFGATTFLSRDAYGTISVMKTMQRKALPTQRRNAFRYWGSVPMSTWGNSMTIST